MPITQPRMIALIRAARDYQQAGQALQQAITGQIQAAQSGAITPTEALSNIAAFASLDLYLAHPSASAVAIELEARHFRREGRANEAAKERQRRRRAQAAPAPAGGPAPVPDSAPDLSTSLDLSFTPSK